MIDLKQLQKQVEEIRQQTAVQGFPPTPQQPPEPDQEEIDKLAAVLTEVVLLLRAGDMEGARKILDNADYLCDIRINASAFPVPEHYLDAARYGVGSTKQYPLQKPLPHSATEIMMRQQLAEREMRRAMENANTTLNPFVILSDNTTDPTDPGA